MPAVETVILSPTTPFDQVILVPVAVNKILSPLHNVVEPCAVMVGGDNVVLAAIAIELEATEVPQVFEAVAVYVPAVETVILFPVAPFDHTTPVPVDVKVMLLPLHNAVGALVEIIGATGVDWVSTVMGSDEAAGPQLLVEVIV